MRSPQILRLFLPAFLLLPALSPPAQATVPSRIANAVSNSSRVPLQGGVSGRVKQATDLGLAPADRKLESLSLRFSLTPAQQADLTQLLTAQINPSSPSYHQWLTPEQFGARFGLSSADMAKVSSWLTAQGFTITAVSRSSTFISFSGTVAQAQQAFGTSIHSLSLNGEQHISNVSDPALPSPIAAVVGAITGLNDFKARPRLRVRTVSVDPAGPHYTQTVAGQTSHYLAPADFYTIYDVNPLLSSSITGAGFTIAVVEQTDPVLADVAAFRAAAGLPANVPKIMLFGTDPGTPNSGDVDESHLDVEWAGATAPGATILFAYGVDVFANSLTGLIDGTGLPANSPPLAAIISSSYGLCENEFTPASLNSYNMLLAQANVEGVTVVSSAGDSGATDCDTSGLATGGLAVDFPGSSPYATSAGGTIFTGDVSNPTSYWNSSNATNGGSALMYIPEAAWNETTATGGLNDGGAGGGGASAFFSKPAWQVGNGVPADASRDVPDISLNAASNHDGYIICSQGSCTNGFLNAQGQLNVFGGTSFSAPGFAGLLALVEQKLGGVPNVGIGNIGPVLYGLANGPNYTSIFHDIVSGNNSVPCSQGTPNCPNASESIGYNASPGYDQATGLGSIDAFNLANNWNNPNSPPTGSGSAIGAVITTTAVTTASQLCAVSGSLPLSIAVSSSGTGAAPTGTVQILVDNAIVGSVPLVNSSATYTLNTSTITSGGHTISAVYSGDSGHAGSKGTVFASDGSLASVDVVSTTKPDFSFTPCTGSASIVPGAVAPGITFTVTPVNGYTGTVTLTATLSSVSLDSSDAANASGSDITSAFTVTPVTITSASGVTTSFVVTGSAPSSTAAVQLKAIPGRGSSPVRSPGAPWYAAGSGATLACMLLLTLPRRRRWGALLAVVLSVGAITIVGCSNNMSTTGNPNPPTGNTTAPASPGTYTFIVTAISGNLTHSSMVTVVVQ